MDHGSDTKRHFIKVAHTKQDDKRRYAPLHWLYQTLCHWGALCSECFTSWKGALISNGTVVSSLADKRRHIRGRGLWCRPVSRECQLTNLVAANWSKPVSASLLQPKQTAALGGGVSGLVFVVAPGNKAAGESKDGGRRLIGEFSSRIQKKFS